MKLESPTPRFIPHSAFRIHHFLIFCCLVACFESALAEDKVVDIPTRAGVTQRFLLIPAAEPKAAVVLFAGGHGGLQLNDAGGPRSGKNNFLVRSAGLFAAKGLTVAVIDAPSDRQSPPYLDGFRQTAEHAADVKAVIGWLREKTGLPVWLIGTSRGTQSVGAVAVALKSAGGPDGIVLTSTILSDPRGRPVPDMDVGTLAVPVLVVHHEQDACRVCLFRDMPRLMEKLSPVPRKELVTFRGGENQGDPCEALAYHGYNGIEASVVARIAARIAAAATIK
jgi:pimeloyl-ACP methyl ester carboxylesterase